MLIERMALLTALGAKDATVEPLGLRAGAPERVSVSIGESRRTFLVRKSEDPERAANHIAVMEALARLRFPAAPTLVALVAGASVETFVEALTAMNVAPDTNTLHAAVDVLARLHGLSIVEGLNWSVSPGALLPAAESQLFRLGFTSEERAAAAPFFSAGASALERSPFGFCHGAATADHVVFARKGVKLVNFERSGFGPQIQDLAAFLATAGLDSGTRCELAARYGARRRLDPATTADLTDLAVLLWGLDWLLTLPRRLIVNLGDDVASAELRLMASRVERAARAGAGEHPAARGIRAALWGAS